MCTEPTYSSKCAIPVPKVAHDAIRGKERARRRGDGSARYALVPLGATLSEFAEGNPSEIPSRTQSVSAFLFGKFSKGPRSFGKTLRELIHPLMETGEFGTRWAHSQRHTLPDTPLPVRLTGF
jgi:hypothetical protein